MDFEHPDLVDLGRRLQRRLEDVLEAEHRAAAVEMRRTSTLRDRLIEIEDRESPVVVWTVGGGRFEGRRLTMAGDHVEITTTRGRALGATGFIEAIDTW